MIRVLASLPQGIFWYPLLLLFTIAFVRLLWSVGQPRTPSRRMQTPASGYVLALTSLVGRARVDHFARLELERHVIGLLLQASGYPGYSVENCRALSASLPDTLVSNAIDGHLNDSQGIRVAVAPSSAAPDLEQRISHILEAVEHLTEAQRG